MGGWERGAAYRCAITRTVRPSPGTPPLHDDRPPPHTHTHTHAHALHYRNMPRTHQPPAVPTAQAPRTLHRGLPKMPLPHTPQTPSRLLHTRRRLIQNNNTRISYAVHARESCWKHSMRLLTVREQLQHAAVVLPKATCLARRAAATYSTVHTAHENSNHRHRSTSILRARGFARIHT